MKTAAYSLVLFASVAAEYVAGSRSNLAATAKAEPLAARRVLYYMIRCTRRTNHRSRAPLRIAECHSSRFTPMPVRLRRFPPIRPQEPSPSAPRINGSLVCGGPASSGRLTHAWYACLVACPRKRTVEKGTELYRIADLSKVWIHADAFGIEAEVRLAEVSASTVPAERLLWTERRR